MLQYPHIICLTVISLSQLQWVHVYYSLVFVLLLYFGITDLSIVLLCYGVFSVTSKVHIAQVRCRFMAAASPYKCKGQQNKAMFVRGSI